MDYVYRLIHLREDNDIKQSTIAKLLGCQQSAISKYEKRRVPYQVEGVVKLYQFYNVSANYVLGLAENMPYPKRNKT